MTLSRSSLASRIRDTRGQTVIFIAVAIVMLLAIAGFAIDTGYVLNARRQLQMSSDAAATAAAQDLSDGLGTGTANTRAHEYSSEHPSGLNRYSYMPNVEVTVAFPCLSGTSYPVCIGGSNAVRVTQTTTLPLFLGRVLGLTQMTISASATSLMKGGSMPPLDVVIVLDVSGSMNGTPLVKAKEGIRALLSVLWPCTPGVNCYSGPGYSAPSPPPPPIDKVGLFQFPGLQNGTSVGYQIDCAASPDPVVVGYGANPIYELIGLVNNYRHSTASALDGGATGKPIIKAVDDGTLGCPGLEVSSVSMGSYFEHVINAAQARLVAVGGGGRANVQNAMIFLSDGDANLIQYPLVNGVNDHPCQRAVNAANAAKAAGTWVYSIRYYNPSGGNGCPNDSGITSYQTMQQIASDPDLGDGFFFNQVSPGDLVDEFQRIALELLNTRIID